MKTAKVLSNFFQWIPIHIRNGGFPPRNPDNRTPVFWVACYQNEVYFVNNSHEILDYVRTEVAGVQTCDDEIFTISDTDYSYQNVKPNDAVKIDEFDEINDSDYLLQISLVIKSKKHGEVHMRTSPVKGGFCESVLLWDSGEIGKYISYSIINSK